MEIHPLALTIRRKRALAVARYYGTTAYLVRADARDASLHWASNTDVSYGVVKLYSAAQEW